MRFYQIALAALLCGLSHSLNAQIEKTFYQTMEITDSTKQIYFNFPDSFEIIPWQQDTKMMFEMVTRIDINSRELVNSLIKDGRYALVAHDSAVGKTIKFATTRSPLKNGQGNIISENITVRVYLPEGFVMKNAVAFRAGSEPLMARKN